MEQEKNILLKIQKTTTAYIALEKRMLSNGFKKVENIEQEIQKIMAVKETPTSNFKRFLNQPKGDLIFVINFNYAFLPKVHDYLINIPLFSVDFNEEISESLNRLNRPVSSLTERLEQVQEILDTYKENCGYNSKQIKILNKFSDFVDEIKTKHVKIMDSVLEIESEKHRIIIEKTRDLEIKKHFLTCYQWELLAEKYKEELTELKQKTAFFSNMFLDLEINN